MVEVTEAHKFATALIGVERFTADGNFHPDYLAMLDKYRQAGVQQGLDMAAGALEEQAKATPLGHENIQRGASTYNWLMSHARLIRKLGCDDA